MNISASYKTKLRYILIAILSFLIFYGCVKYLLPILFPFITAYALSRLILPGVKFLNKKLNFHKTTANIIMFLLLIISLIIILYFLITKLTSQLSDFIKNWDSFKTSIENVTKDCCNAIEKYTGVSGNTLYQNVSKQADNTAEMVKEKVLPEIMNYSIATIKGVFNFFIFILITFISLFFFTKDNDTIQHYLNNCIFSREIAFIRRIIKLVVAAYIKSQLIIMSLVAILCTIGFTIIKSPYSVLYGITVGILDIFPLIGAGTFLVPVGIYYCIQGEYMNSIILFVLFVLCYLLREILEPKLMGTRIGMHPLVSLVSVFTGYKLFGVLGMLIGPFGYVFISEVLKATSKKDSFTP